MVLVHVMPWFESKAVSGRWGWHWTMEKTDPDKGALASHDRPACGPYDSGDPATIATQVALMKAAGIDGAIIDWNGPDGFDHFRLAGNVIDQLATCGGVLAAGEGRVEEGCSGAGDEFGGCVGIREGNGGTLDHGLAGTEFWKHFFE
jgi:hypothetical protein